MYFFGALVIMNAMNILLTYATYSSGTRVAGECVAQALTEAGHSVSIKEVAELNPEDMNAYELIIMGSPSWYNHEKDGMPHEDFIIFSEKAKGKSFEGKKFAVYGLGDKTYAHFCGAVDYLENFIKEIKGTLKAQSIRVDSFFNDESAKEQALKDWARTLVQ